MRIDIFQQNKPKNIGSALGSPPIKRNSFSNGNNSILNILGISQPAEKLSSSGEGLFVIQEREDELLRSKITDHKTIKNLGSVMNPESGNDSPTARQRSYSSSV